jgi:signal transduction histidine kinase/ActR/RegA family two-component response regulator
MQRVEYLHREVLQQTRCLIVTLDDSGGAAGIECPFADWEPACVKVGSLLPEALRAVLDSAPDDGQTHVFPFVYLNGGEIVDVHVWARRTPRQILLRDVTEPHQAELKYQQKAHEISLLLEHQAELNRQLEVQREELQRANKAKSRFIASMSHEFRTPITSIMGHAKMLFGKLEGAEGPAAIQRASWHLLALVENLLEQARQGEGDVALQTARVDLDRVAMDMRDLFETQAAARGLTLNIACSAPESGLFADELRLRQVLINLLGNAIRYTDRGSVGLVIQAVSDAVEFRVDDTGPGIRTSDRERIFKPFMRLDSSQQGGAGLGLSISRSLVAAMGGRLDLDTEPGCGSSFHFRLPLGVAEHTGTQADLAGLSVLLVDDDADVLALYELYLHDWGLQVHCATSVQQALPLLDRHSFDVVISDLHLGDESGAELLRHVRDRHLECRTILCSGSGMAPDWWKRYGELADDFLLKPVQPDRLSAAISHVLPSRDG